MCCWVYLLCSYHEDTFELTGPQLEASAASLSCSLQHKQRLSSSVCNFVIATVSHQDRHIQCLSAKPHTIYIVCCIDQRLIA